MLPIAAVAVAAIVAGLAVTAPVAVATNGPGLPPARVKPLRPREIELTPRVVSLQPPVKSVAPAHPTPNIFTVNADVLFDFNSAVLTINAEAVLTKVVEQLKTLGTGTVTITGYADSIGTVSYNLTLSENRAKAAQSYLRSTVNNPALTYQAMGRGEADPVAPNTLPNGQDNPSGRAQNRRVTIVYTPS